MQSAEPGVKLQAAEGTAMRRPDYGLDAPSVVRNLGIFALLGFALFGSVSAGLWSGRISLGANVVLEVSSMGIVVGLSCSAMALYMIWSSRVGKVAGREKLLDRIAWTGNERVLDIGCGRGLMLIGAAGRLTTGSAVGVDIWQSEDLSGNTAESTMANARREGVQDRVRVETADMQALPFPDASFDVIVSKAAIHNLYKRDARAKAIAEIARVLAPGGAVLIDDIRHIREYEHGLRSCGLTDISRAGSAAVAAALAVITWGSLRPGIVLARKKGPPR
ncbi:MAG: class I SAM-dependent methyltransferase [Myxococcales bacterium]